MTQLNASQEDSKIEAKLASQFGRPVLESICAFANEPNLGGGFVLLGVARAKGTEQIIYEAVGVSNPEQLQADIASACTTSFNRPIRPYIWTEEVQGKHVVAVSVAESQPYDKPLYLTNMGLPRGAMRRIGSADLHGTEDDILLLYQDRSHHTLDEGMVPGADISDLDPSVIGDYRRYRREVAPSAEELRWSDEELLYALGCVDKQSEALVPTVAGLLLFGTDIALRRHFPMMRVDYVHVPGKEWIQDPERRFTTVEFRGPLLRLIPRIHAAVLNDIPKQFSLPLGNTQRVDVPIIPDRVMREAIVNAVMHRAYRTHGATQIIRYSNRLEIRNPGHSLVSEDHLGEPGSKTRNPKIAAVLHETRFAETKGSGIRVMREMMSIANLTPPAFESDRGRDQFIATFLFHHFLDPGDMAWLALFREHNLTDDEAKALVFVREVGAITDVVYRHLNQVSRVRALQRLERLESLELLERQGQGQREFYKGTQLLLNIGESTVLSTTQLPLYIPDLSVQTPEPTPVPLELGAVLPKLHDLPVGLVKEIAQLGDRPTNQQVRQIIIRLCSLSPLTASQLAEILGRRRDYLNTVYLRPMIDAKELYYTVPDRPHSPKQAYVSQPLEPLG